MSAPVRDAFIASIDPAIVPAVLELDRAIMAACAGLDTKISYQMLTYALEGDFRHWICAIDPGRPPRDGGLHQGRQVPKKALHLRFLYGVLLADPRGVLRAGTSTLRTIDFTSLEDIDTQLVVDYVKEAVARLDKFRAQSHGR